MPVSVTQLLMASVPPIGTPDKSMRNTLAKLYDSCRARRGGKKERAQPIEWR